MPNLAALAIVPRVLLLGAAALLLAAWQDRQLPSNKDRVRFESARYQAGPLPLRLALEHGEPIRRPGPELVDGYLTMPEGDGPFPAIVHLHGCGGLPKAFKNGSDRLWPQRLAGWGYVVLSVDSFTTRGIDNTCSGESAPRVADAYGALAYLAQLPLVDVRRVGLIGFSAGGIATLSAVGKRAFDLFEDARKFKAAVAFYPYCRPGRTFAIPTLILIGDADDWTPASLCRTMVSIRRNDDPVRLVVYRGAHHVFDAPSPGRRYFGHWLEYNAPAAEQATEEVRRFLAEQLGR